MKAPRKNEAIDKTVHICMYSCTIPDDVEIVSRENIGKRLHVQIEHGPSRESGWIYLAGYPEYFLTNGETTAEDALRIFASRKCFCGGEWWLKTNGLTEVVRVVKKSRYSCNCGESYYEFMTNMYPIAESEVGDER